MFEKKLYDLKIENNFKNLIPPLTKEEFNQLEENILQYGCREPITVWKNIIVDGHNRYSICQKHNIKFYIQEINFKNKAEISIWICSNQLGRRNISEETKRYLIGKRYEMEKKLNSIPNPKGQNQYSNKEIAKDKNLATKTSEELGKEYNVSPTTIKKYGYYANNIDKLGKKNPEIISEIFKGNIKLSHSTIMKLANKQKKTTKFIYEQMIKDNKSNKKEKIKKLISSKSNPKVEAKVKETPSFDPDADISSLTYTIPSWISSLERTFNLVDFNSISQSAKNKIQKELRNLKATIDIMLEATEI